MARRGKGLATEGGKTSVELWRERLLDDERLISITAPANVRSRRVMEKLGFEYGGAARWHGHDVIWLALDR